MLPSLKCADVDGLVALNSVRAKQYARGRINLIQIHAPRREISEEQRVLGRIGVNSGAGRYTRYVVDSGRSARTTASCVGHIDASSLEGSYEGSNFRLKGSDLRVLCTLGRLEVTDIDIEVIDLRVEGSDLRVEGSDLRVLCALACLERSDIGVLCALARLEVSDLRA